MTLDEYLRSLNREFSGPIDLLIVMLNYHPTSPEDKLEKDMRVSNLKRRIHKEIHFFDYYRAEVPSLVKIFNKSKKLP